MANLTTPTPFSSVEKGGLNAPLFPLSVPERGLRGAVFSFIVTLAFLGFALPAFSQAPTQYEAISASPTALSTPIPKFKYLNDSDYAESFSFVADLEDGGFFQVQFALTNIGIGKRNGSIRVVYVDKAGKHTQEIIAVSSQEQETLQNGIKFGESKLTLQGGKYFVSIMGKEMRATAEYTPYTPAFRPGNGRIYFGGKSKFYDMTALFVRGRVIGEAEFGGETRRFKGFATADNTYSNQNPRNRDTRWFRMKKVREDPALLFTVLYPAQGAPVGWLVIANGNKLEALDLSPQPAYKDFIEAPESRFGYKIPTKVALKPEAIEDLKITAELKGVYFRQDVIGEMGGFVGFFVRQAVQPESYTLKYETDLVYKGVPRRSNALVEITFVTKE